MVTIEKKIKFGGRQIGQIVLVLLEKLRVSKHVIDRLKGEAADKFYSEEEIFELLDRVFPDPDKGKKSRNRIMEASAIAAYHRETDITIVEILVCDDARQFTLLTDELALCWVHDGRHYKKLGPILECNQTQLDQFLDEYWGFYRKLRRYKERPDGKLSVELSEEFDRLF